MYAYLIDTGIRLSHKDFQGRASNGYNAYPGVPFVDANGHGTHCAGTIAGKEYGVSKRAQLIAVKVFHTAGVSINLLRSWILLTLTVNHRHRSGRI